MRYHPEGGETGDQKRINTGGAGYGAASTDGRLLYCKTGGGGFGTASNHLCACEILKKGGIFICSVSDPLRLDIESGF